MGNILGRFVNLFRSSSTANPTDTTSPGNAASLAAPAKFSWDAKPRLDPANFMIVGQSGVTVTRLPGSIAGQGFAIQDCDDCDIQLFDNINTITVDNCKNCRLIVGPVQSSIFVRNVTDSSIMVSCGQFRTRDCRAISIHLHCNTQPIIESCTEMHIACYQLVYSELRTQLQAAKLPIYNNNWSFVHDFTPEFGGGGKNYDYLDEAEDVRSFYPSLNRSSGEPSIRTSTAIEELLIPVTSGLRPVQTSERCLVLIYETPNQTNQATKLVKETTRRGLATVQSKQLQLSKVELVRILEATPGASPPTSPGDVIAFEFAGPDVLKIARELTVSWPATCFYASPTQAAANVQLETFYSVANMSLLSV